MKDYYKLILKKETNNLVLGKSVPRGRIYDRNYKIIVDNIAVKSIYYTKKSGTTTKEEIELAYKMSEKINLDYNELLKRNLKEFYLVLQEDNLDSLITHQEWEDLSNRKLTDKEIYELKIERITDDDLKKLTNKDKKAAYLYYLMNKGYFYEEKIIKEKATDDEYAYISENASNLNGFNTKLSWERVYPYGDVFRSVLGKVSEGLPKEEVDDYLNKGYSLDDRIGVSGLEKQYEDILRGEKEVYQINDDNSLSLIKNGTKGNDIVLSIDIEVQKELETMLKEEIKKTKKEANTEFYNRSYVIIQKPSTGEIISMAAKQIDTTPNNKTEFYEISSGAMTSSITPGSVVKGASMIVGYNTKAINIGTIMEDRCIKLANTPAKCSWATLGTINDLDAIRQSSNVYQYKIAMKVGGFEYAYNKKLEMNLEAFDIYRNIFYQFGLGVKTGIDFPMEDNGYKGKSDNGELLINYAIGQYDTYTPMQLSQYISTIANGGVRIKPHFLKSVLKNREDDKKEVLYEVSTVTLNKVTTEKKYMDRVKQGMRLVMTNGTGQFGYMNYISKAAGKTGTAESFVDIDNDGIVDFESISNNFVGYAPYDKPTMTITTSSPDVQNPNRGSYKTIVNTRISKRATKIYFDHYNYDGSRKK